MPTHVEESVWHVYVEKSHTVQNEKYRLRVISSYNCNNCDSEHVIWPLSSRIKLGHVELEFCE